MNLDALHNRIERLEKALVTLKRAKTRDTESFILEIAQEIVILKKQEMDEIKKWEEKNR